MSARWDGDVLEVTVSFLTPHALAETSVDRFINGQKTVFLRIGPATLAKFHARAQLLSTGGEPYWRAPVLIPSAARELFFDVEVDSMRDICTASSNATWVTMPRSDLYSNSRPYSCRKQSRLRGSVSSGYLHSLYRAVLGFPRDCAPESRLEPRTNQLSVLPTLLTLQL